MILAPLVLPPTHPSRDGGQTARVGDQAIKARGQLVRGRPIGEGEGNGAQSHFYVFLSRPEAESSDVVIIGIIPHCHRDASVLYDMDSTYS